MVVNDPPNSWIGDGREGLGRGWKGNVFCAHFCQSELNGGNVQGIQGNWLQTVLVVDRRVDGRRFGFCATIKHLKYVFEKYAFISESKNNEIQMGTIFKKCFKQHVCIFLLDNENIKSIWNSMWN